MTTGTSEREITTVNNIERRLARARASQEAFEDISSSNVDDRITETLSPPWLRLVSADIKHLSSILAQLGELHGGPERDEYGILRPTDHAFNRTLSLLIDTAIVAATRGNSVPYGCVSTDSEGGVRIEWVGSMCSVHLVIPSAPQEKSYIYHESGDEYGTTESVNAEVLGDWLRVFHSVEQG